MLKVEKQWRLIPRFNLGASPYAHNFMHSHQQVQSLSHVQHTHTHTFLPKPTALLSQGPWEKQVPAETHRTHPVPCHHQLPNSLSFFTCKLLPGQPLDRNTWSRHEARAGPGRRNRSGPAGRTSLSLSFRAPPHLTASTHRPGLLSARPSRDPTRPHLV